VTLSVTDVF